MHMAHILGCVACAVESITETRDNVKLARHFALELLKVGTQVLT